MEYRKVFKHIHLYFFEELLQEPLSFYRKIAALLGIMITRDDIPDEKMNTKENKQQGYMTLS